MKLKRSMASSGLALLAAFGLLAGGCRTAGPDYREPATPMPAAWSTGLDGGLTNRAADAATLSRWWTVFGDPVLSDLMECARTNNLDVRQAEARLLEARARRGIANADRFPTLDASGSVGRSQGSENLGGGKTANRFNAGLDASWELDFVGRNKRTLEAADATLQASEEALRDTLVSLLGEVALSYVDIRAYQARLAIAETNLLAQTDTWQIASWRREAGLTTQIDEDQARLSLEQTRAEIPSQRAGLAQAVYRLSVLTGQPPGALMPAFADRKAIPVPPAGAAIGIPADLLRRRPDVRRTERLLAAQTAQIGVATAKRYPSFSLSGSIGLESLIFHDLFTAGARTVAASLISGWNLFDGGRIEQGIAVEEARREEALALHKASVLAALLDVENTLVATVNERDRRRSLADALVSGQRAFELARDQYASGLTDFQTVLSAQRSLLTVETQCANSDAEAASNLIRLYKALGGGWTALEPAALTAVQPSSGENK